MEQRPPSPILRGQLISPEHWCSVQYFELDHKVHFFLLASPVHIKNFVHWKIF